MKFRTLSGYGGTEDHTYADINAIWLLRLTDIDKALYNAASFDYYITMPRSYR